MAKIKEKSTEPIEHLKTYIHHGVDISPGSNGEAVGVCPFCSEEEKFYVNISEGMFHCKNGDCGERGNKYTFLQKHFDACLDSTKSSRIASLAKNRKLPKDSFVDAELAYDRGNSRWLIPIRNTNSSIVNLRIWNSKDNIVMQTAACKSHIYNGDLIDSSISTVYLCEGEWDAIAMNWLLKKNKEETSCAVASPGAGVFKEEWCQLFNKKHVAIVYDYDKAGIVGLARTAKLLKESGVCKSIQTITWPESYPDKFDIRDYVSKHQQKPKGAFKKLISFLSDFKGTKSKEFLTKCKTFDDVCLEFKKYIHLSSDMESALLIILSTILSNKIFKNPFCPLWVFIVGPAGSGKTLLLQATSDLDEAVWVTTLGPKTLVSGWKGSGGDPSLLPHLIGNTMIIEDFTGIMGLSSSDQDEIYGVLRSAYNGRYEKSFGNSGFKVYPDPNSDHETCHFTMVAGATGAIHADQRANHGERFIKFHMKSDDYDPIPQIKAAISSTVREDPPELKLRDPVNSFVASKLSRKVRIPKVPKWVETRIIGLGQIVSMIRAVVTRKSGELVLRPEAEVGSRIAQQLIKLGQSMAYTLGKRTVDNDCYSLICKVALDTCYGWHRDVFLCVLAHQDTGIKRLDIAVQTSTSPTTTKRVLEDLMELGVTTFNLLETGGKGQPPSQWRITEKVFDIVKLAKLEDSEHARSLLDATRAKPATKKVKLVEVEKPKRKKKTTRKYTKKT